MMMMKGRWLCWNCVEESASEERCDRNDNLLEYLIKHKYKYLGVEKGENEQIHIPNIFQGRPDNEGCGR